MSALGDDCYFFYTSTCAKGASCPFRHVEAAKTCRIICQHWQMGGCLRPMCKFRHSDFMFQLSTNEVPCYWESQPAGCVKMNCAYKHLKPRPQDGASTTTESIAVDNSTVASTSPGNEVVTSQIFVQPVVTPVIIQPSVESEESNSSPVKRQHEVISATQDSKIQVDPKRQETEQNTSENSKNKDSRHANAIQEQTITKKTKKVRAGVNKGNKNIALKKKELKTIVGKRTGKITPKGKKSFDRPQKSMKERLGKALSPVPAVLHSSEQSDSESNSGSDDSIENIKVMSMEEIFRQKALESMLKKRATEGKGLPPAREKKTHQPSKEGRTSLSAVEKKPSRQNLVRKSPIAKERRSFPTTERKTLPLDKKHSIAVKKTKQAPISEESYSSSSQEEESDEEDSTKQSSDESFDEKDSTKRSSGRSSDTSSSSSADSDDDSADDSEEIDVRRVVVDLEGEKAARKKAKESFLKKQKLSLSKTKSSKNRGTVIQPTIRQLNQMPLSALNKLNNRKQHLNKRSVNIDYDSDDIVSSRVSKPLTLNVRDRLGKSTALHKTSSDARLLSRAEKFEPTVSVSKPVITKKGDASRVAVRKVSRSSSSEDDLAEVKVKTLEEIRLEKMRKLAAENRGRKVTSQESKTEFHRPLSVRERLGKIPDEQRNREVELPIRQRLGNFPDEKQNKEVELPIRQRLGNLPDEKQKRDFELPINERHGITSEKKQTEEVEKLKGRQVVLVNDSGSKSDDTSSMNPSDEQKKAKKRRWRSQRRNVDSSLAETVVDDERTTIVAASSSANGVDHKVELNCSKEDYIVDESPFESLRKRALMKKLQSKKLKLSASLDEVTSVEADLETSHGGQVKEESPGTKSHKHRHKHHKKTKTERQIYMPPAMKNTVTATRPLTPENIPPKREIVAAPTAKVSPQKRDPHPIAAAWAAGLTLSSKGTAVRRPQPLPAATESFGVVSRPEIGDRLGVREIATKPKEIISSDKTYQSSIESSGVTIKSFSEIMAEKRKRRLEMQAQKSETTDLSVSTNSSIEASSSSPAQSMPASTSQLVSTSSKAVDTKPRVPISPIVFMPDSSSGTVLKYVDQDDNSANTALKASLLPPIASSQHDTNKSLNQKVRLTPVKKNSIKKGDKKKKVKKLFKGNTDQNCITSPEDSSNTSHVSTHISTSIPSKNVVTEISQDTSSQNTWSARVSTDSGASSSQSLKNTATSSVLDTSSRQNVPKFSTAIDNANGKKQLASSNKHSIPATMVDSVPNKKKARLSIEDEFNFFEDEFLDVDDAIITDNIEHIDDLLQDIDELLS